MSLVLDGTSGITTNSGTVVSTTDATISGITVGKGGGSVSTNTSVGASALNANTTGSASVAFGYQALATTTAGVGLTGVGYQALNANTGDYNTAVGWSALLTNSTGIRNTAVGVEPLKVNTTGSYNTAIGMDALVSNTTASNNTAVGYQAGYAVTTGANNTFLGTQIRKNATTGAGNVIIGALNSSGTYAPLYDVTTTNDRLALGTTSTTNAYVQVSWTVLSDARDKTNVVNLDKGLSFINSLRPVEYQFKKSREDETPHGNLRYGFLAQEILELEGDKPVIIDNEDSEKLRYNGESLVPVLVKAIQELKAIVDTQATEIAELKAKA